MAIQSDGSYGIPKGLVCSFPVIVENGKYRIIKDQPIDSFYQSLIDKTVKELTDEREAIEHLLK
jgi:malate/lactate dehydrogenase